MTGSRRFLAMHRHLGRVYSVDRETLLGQVEGVPALADADIENRSRSADAVGVGL
jgi:hypothetical protein